jgi:nucleotide-binding universal stress UspA family protein
VIAGSPLHIGTLSGLLDRSLARNDRPAEAILRAAEQYEAMTIVVGATSRGPMAGALLGSATYQVVHRSTRPVLVVPTPAES